MKRSKTRKSLKTSGLALVVCIVMLIGTTFAWFTDSITNSGNKIQAGSLDIGAVSYDIDANGDKEVTIPGVNGDNAFKFENEGQDLETSKDSIINEDLWEPGKSSAKLLQVTNNGTLAAKIELSFDVNDGGLQNALWFDFVQLDESNIVTGTFQKRPMSQLQQVADGVEVPLAAGGNVRFVLVYGMNEEADNTYQGKNFEADVTINATQLNSEEDGFGNPDYDKEATYPTTPGNFEEALDGAKPGDVLKLSAGEFKMPSADYVIPEGVSIIGDGNTTIALNSGSPTDTTTAGMLISNDNVTLSNVKVTGKSMGSKDYNSYIRITGNNVTLDNVTIDALYTNVSPIRIDSTTADNEITIKNSSIYSTNGRAIYIVDGANGKVNIENTEITGVYPISVNSSSSQELVLNVSDSKLHGWISYGDIKSAIFKNTEFSKGDSSYEFIRPYVNTTFTDCTFVDGFKVGAGATGKTYTFNNCTSAGVKLTAQNIQAQLLDMSGSDETNLKGCTIVVDGVSMTPGQ